MNAFQCAPEENTSETRSCALYLRALAACVLMVGLSVLLAIPQLLGSDDVESANPEVGLKEALKRLPEWRWDHPDLTRPEQELLCETALRAQKCKTQDLTAILRNFDSSTQRGEGWATGKTFLLLRVVFELPNDGVSRDRAFGGWIGDPPQVRNGRSNPMWPIRWQDDLPHLMARYEGYAGAPYNSAAEYVRFKDAYRFRALGAKRRVGQRAWHFAMPTLSSERAGKQL